MTSKALILRTCRSDLTSHKGFRWPESGPVSAPDWDPTPLCGNGLHGFLWGEGNGALVDWNDSAKWLVVEVESSEIVGLEGKVKFPRGNVVCCGDKKGATDYLIQHGGEGKAVIGAYVASGDSGTSASGYGGTSISGNYGTSISGTQGTSISGHHGTSKSGKYGTSTSGAYGTTISGEGGTSTSGAYGTAIAGTQGTSISGNGGTSTSGFYGTATSGEGGIISIWSFGGSRRRLVTGYIGEGGLEPNVPYRLDDNGEFVKYE